MTLTKKQLAAALQVSTRTIDHLCRSRLLPFHLVGSRKRFTDEDVQAFLASRSFGHPANLPSPQAHNE